MTGSDSASAQSADVQPPDPQPPRRVLDPLIVVLAGVVAGVVLVSMDALRPGMFVAAGALALGALLRLVLRPRAARSLVVRARHVDVFVLASLAVAIAVLAAVTPLDRVG